MNESERQLLEGLKALAAREPQQASPRIEQTLRATFRARAERKRRVIFGWSAAGLVAMAAAIVVLLLMRVPHSRSVERPQVLSEAPALPVAGVQNAVVRTDELSGSFYPLPEADELPPVETTLVVRVQLPISSLELMGFPVDVDAGAEPVQAEVLLGQDGLARGVRLAQ
jgi:hypothetical protein